MAKNAHSGRRSRIKGNQPSDLLWDVVHLLSRGPNRCRWAMSDSQRGFFWPYVAQSVAVEMVSKNQKQHRSC